jgi:multiple sugar transport system permease protein
MSHRTNRSALAVLSPATGPISVFVFIPTAFRIWLSFQNGSTQTGFETDSFIGLQNFIDICGPSTIGRDFKTAPANTALYTLPSVARILLSLRTVLPVSLADRSQPRSLIEGDAGSLYSAATLCTGPGGPSSSRTMS